MSSNVLKEVLKEVKVVREKLERLEELVEGRLVGLEELASYRFIFSFIIFVRSKGQANIL